MGEAGEAFALFFAAFAVKTYFPHSCGSCHSDAKEVGAV